MKAMVMHEWNGPYVEEDRPIPEVGPLDVLIKVKACGAGYTLTGLRAGLNGGSLPRIIGHEIGGIVEEVGPMVTTCKPGDRVCVSFYLTCGHCKWCVRGRETLCDNFGGFVGAAIDGGFAEYAKIPASNVIPIPEGIGFAEAGVTTDAVATNWHVFKERCKTKPNDRVLVVGAGGGVGIHTIQVAKIFGAHVIGADVSDEKLELAKKYGADEVINVTGKEMSKEVMKLTEDSGVDAVVDMVSTKQTFEESVKSLGRGGTHVLIAVPRPRGPADFNIDGGRFIFDEITITGCRCATRQEIRESLELVQRGLVKPVVMNTFPLGEANKVQELIDNMALLGRTAFVFE
ncbi:MAG: zinc-binding dehydrogenase [Deltaproteobacteria bacterium]|nr:zinc-binding dehydrogenase [Deltaproteobacteria bacterium]